MKVKDRGKLNIDPLHCNVTKTAKYTIHQMLFFAYSYSALSKSTYNDVAS